MVDLSFSSQAKNFVPLSLLRFLADTSLANIPEALAYIGETGLNAVKGLFLLQFCDNSNLTPLPGMDLVRRGRLSVQRVNKDAWDVIVLLADNGGWTDLDLKPKRRTAPGKGKRKMKETSDDGSGDEQRLSDSQATKMADGLDVEDGEGTSNASGEKGSAKSKASTLRAKRKRKVEDVGDRANLPSRKSTRAKK